MADSTETKDTGDTTANESSPDSGSNSQEGSGKPVEEGFLKIGDTVLTKEETKTRLETLGGKAAAFDKVQRESAELKKGKARAEQKVADIMAANAGDVDAIQRLVGYPDLGVTQEAADETIAMVKAQGGDSSSNNGAEGGKEGRAGRKVGMADLDDEVRGALNRTNESQREALKARLYKKLDAALDKDEILGQYLANEQNAGFAKRARKFARGELRERAAEAQRAGDRNWAPGSRDFEAVVQAVRGWAHDVTGTPVEAGSGQQGATKTGLLGIGPAPLGLGTTLHQHNKPPERKPVTDPDHLENFTDRLAHADKD